MLFIRARLLLTVIVYARFDLCIPLGGRYHVLDAQHKAFPAMD